jgi:hypothetical protein
MSSQRTLLLALRRLIGQAELVYSDRAVPAAQRERGAELLTAASALVGDLLGQAHSGAAAELGSKGGTQTAKRGSDYFRQLAARRKVHGGGRPRKPAK